MNLDKFSLNGEILPITEAKIAISNIEYQYGFGVYETIRVVKDIPYFVDVHIGRILQSAKMIGIVHTYSAGDIYQDIFNLISEIGSNAAFNIKILLIGAPEATKCLLYMIPLAPKFPDRKIYKYGISLVTTKYERLFPQVKTLNMLGSYLAYRMAKQGGHQDALLINNEGFITEGTRSNFFLIKDKTIFTAPRDMVLDGVTKRTILNVAMKNGFIIKEKNLSPSELGDYDGAFITNTSDRIVPVRQIDNFCFSAIPESIKELIQLFDEYLGKYAKSFIE
ncbi:aminotransferase class IV [Patescibacteria group bacterium]|nr:aminotransferase class IV [Patescibacteria group bacterium]